MSFLPLDPPVGPAPESWLLPAEKLLEGNPRQSHWPHYQNAAQTFATGHWQSEPGKWRIHYTEDEYCEILAGRSVITDAAGNARTVQAGDRFVIARGFTGTWEVLETTLKIYVVYEAPP